MSETNHELAMSAAKRIEMVLDLEDAAYCIADTYAPAMAELEQTKECLSDLYDCQNGPPLVRHEKRWQEVMDRAAKLLGYDCPHNERTAT